MHEPLSSYTYTKGDNPSKRRIRVTHQSTSSGTHTKGNTFPRWPCGIPNWLLYHSTGLAGAGGWMYTIPPP